MIIIDAFHTIGWESLVETRQYWTEPYSVFIERAILYWLFLFYFIGADDALRFQGNTTSKDHFRLLQSDGEYLLVGARYCITNPLDQNLNTVIRLRNFGAKNLLVLFWCALHRWKWQTILGLEPTGDQRLFASRAKVHMRYIFTEIHRKNKWEGSLAFSPARSEPPQWK